MPRISSVSASSQSVTATIGYTDPVIHFTNLEEIFSLANRAREDYVIFKGILIPKVLMSCTNTSLDVSPEDFAAIDAERFARRRKFRLRRYYASSRTLMISFTTAMHERLHLELHYGLYCYKLYLMGKLNSWSPTGAATFGKGGDSGQGDSTGSPRKAHEVPAKWPTLVIEAGAYETLAALRRDMHWWFEASDHAVKIVLLAKLDYHHRQISLDKFEEPTVVRQGATTTRAASRLVQQSITIVRNDGTAPPSYDVAGGPLVLDFRLLFLREPGPGEGDIVFSIPDLQYYAESVWGEVEV